MPQIIYALVNEAMPGLVKIGRTERPVEERLREFYNTAVPYPFQCIYAAEVSDITKVERLLHNVFKDKRVNPGREFFKVDTEQVISAIRLAEVLRDVTPRQEYYENEIDQAAVTKSREIKSRINLEKIGVPVGSELVFLKNDSIRVLTTENNKVFFRGDSISLSQSALIILTEMGYKMQAVQGPAYWLFEGETLANRRERLEEEFIENA